MLLINWLVGEALHILVGAALLGLVYLGSRGQDDT